MTTKKGSVAPKPSRVEHGRGGDYKGKPKELRVIDPREVASILKCAVVMAEGKTSPEWMLVYLGWITGAKLKELISTPVGRISFHYHWIKPGTSETRVPIELTEALMKPIKRYFEEQKLPRDPTSQFDKTQKHIFHNDAHDTNAMSARWAQEAFKRLLKGAHIDKPYSISCLRGLYKQMVGEVTGAYPALVDYIAGNGRYTDRFEDSRTLAFRRRATEHFERVLRQVEVI